jgi:hypothetical protein
MKLLAMMGDLILITYLIGLILMTVMNVSRSMFDPMILGEDKMGFWARQGMVFVWLLAMFSDSGIKAFRIIWTGDDK